MRKDQPAPQVIQLTAAIKVTADVKTDNPVEADRKDS
jgi:hypothetical protein